MVTRKKIAQGEPDLPKEIVVANEERLDKGFLANKGEPLRYLSITRLSDTKATVQKSTEIKDIKLKRKVD